MKTVYLEMLADKISPDMSTFNAIVLAYCKLGNVVEADLYVSRIAQAGFSPILLRTIP